MPMIHRFLVDLVTAYLLLVTVTSRIVLAGYHRIEPIAGAGAESNRRQSVVTIWHGLLGHALPPASRRASMPYGCMCSSSREGDMAARLLSNLGYHPIRGSTGHGGARGLRDMIRQSQALGGAPLCLTVDGSRGPREIMKPGAVLLASRIQGDVVPVGIASRRSPVLRSWDRFRVPLPFSRMAMVVGPRLSIPARISGAEIEIWRRQAERLLQAVQRRADRLARFDSGRSARAG